MTFVFLLLIGSAYIVRLVLLLYPLWSRFSFSIVSFLLLSPWFRFRHGTHGLNEELGIHVALETVVKLAFL